MLLYLMEATLISLLTLKKTVPHLVQLGDCQFKRRYRELLALTSHESKAIECLERIGNLEINIDRKIVCEPRLDTAYKLGRRWRRLSLSYRKAKCLSWTM